MDFQRIPTASKIYFGAAAAFEIGVYLGYIPERLLSLQLSRVAAGEVWRLASVFYQKFSPGNMTLYLNLIEESSWLETSYYNSTRRFAAVLAAISVLAVIFSAFTNNRTPGPIVVFALDYLYSRRSPARPLFRVRSYLHLFMAFLLLPTESLIIGTFIGHCIFYFEDILPVTSSLPNVAWPV